MLKMLMLSHQNNRPPRLPHLGNALLVVLPHICKGTVVVFPLFVDKGATGAVSIVVPPVEVPKDPSLILTVEAWDMWPVSVRHLI